MSAAIEKRLSKVHPVYEPHIWACLATQRHYKVLVHLHSGAERFLQDKAAKDGHNCAGRSLRELVETWAENKGYYASQNPSDKLSKLK